MRLFRFPLLTCRWLIRVHDHLFYFPSLARDIRSQFNTDDARRNAMSMICLDHMRKTPAWFGSFTMEELGQKAAFISIRSFPGE